LLYNFFIIHLLNACKALHLLTLPNNKNTMSLLDKLKQFQEDKTGVNIQAGKTFMEANAAKPGVHVQPEGWQYEILQEGNTNKKPLATSTVTCHYHGMLIDGSVFDSSVQRNSPATFPLNRVIKGWQLALPLMDVGSKWRVVLPPELAYGNQSAGKITPGSTLIFEIELIDF
jgi:FKBP-type peptidyl-prolyl cis-trans isomerase FklB